MRTWICCRPSDIPEISFSSASPASETCTHSVFMWKDVISPDCAPSPHPEKNWKGRWRDITGASLSEAVSPKGRPVPLPAKQTGSIFSHPISSLIRTERKNSSATWSPARMRSRISETQEKTWRKSCSACAAIISSISPHTRGGMIWKYFWKRQKNEGTPCWQTENFSSSP